jgi:hypothetical protein
MKIIIKSPKAAIVKNIKLTKNTLPVIKDNKAGKAPRQ